MRKNIDAQRGGIRLLFFYVSQKEVNNGIFVLIIFNLLNRLHIRTASALVHFHYLSKKSVETVHSTYKRSGLVAP